MVRRVQTRKNEGYIEMSHLESKLEERLTSDRNTAETEPSLDVEHVLDGVLWREHDGVRDEAVLMAFNSANHGSL